MADVNANIGVHIDTSATIAQLKALRAEISRFNQSVTKSSAAAAIAQRDLQTNLLNAINATGKFHAKMGLIRTSTESFTHALETNKLSMREYFRYAGGASTTFRKLFTKEFDTISQVAADRVKRMQTQYIKLGRDASGAMKAISITPTTLNMKDYGTQVALAAQKQALLNQLLKQGSTNLLNFGKNTQWAGRQLMVGFTIPLAYLGTTAAKTFMAIEEQALKFRRVYGEMFTTSAQTNKALEDVRALAEEFTKYGIAVEKTLELAATAAATGKMGADLMAQVQSATRLAVLGAVEQEQALETTISLTNAFGLAADELAQKINFLNAVENQTVVSIEDLTIAIPKAGPVVRQLGGSVEDLAFFLTAMKEGGINASEGANALKSGLASLINPTEKASKMLAQMGINVTGIVEANKGNVKGIVLDFAAALDTLDPLNRARAIEQMFGKFQFARLSTLFSNVTKEGTQAARVLDLTAASVEELAILSERELKAVEDSIGVNFKKAVQELRIALEPIGKVFLQTITPIAETIARLLDKFNNLGDGTKKFIVIATTLIGVIGPTFLMTFGLLANAVANIIKLFTTMRGGFLRLKGGTAVLAEQTNYLTKEQMEATTVAAALDQAHNRLTQRFTSEAVALEKLRAAFDRATAAQARFAATNPGMMIPGFKGAKKFNFGTIKVPGYAKGTDTVPAMLTPGEAVIPADIAQDERFKPIIEALVTGNLPGYNDGTTGVGTQSGNKFKSTVFFDFDDTLAKSTAAIEQWKAERGITGKTTLEMYDAFNKDVVAGKVRVPAIAENIDKLKRLQAAGVDVRILTARTANETNLESLKKVLGANGIVIEDSKIHLNNTENTDAKFKAGYIKDFLKDNPDSRVQLIDDKLENVKAVRNLSSAKGLSKRVGAIASGAAIEPAEFVQMKDGRAAVKFQGRVYPVGENYDKAQRIVKRVNDDLLAQKTQRGKLEYASWATGRFSDLVDNRPAGRLISEGRIFRKDRGRGGVSYDVRKALNNLMSESSYENAIKGTGSGSERQLILDAIDDYQKTTGNKLTEKQIKQALQIQASHVWPSKDEKGQPLKFNDPRKWMQGHVFDEWGAFNNYLNRVGVDKNGNPTAFQKFADAFIQDDELFKQTGLNKQQILKDLEFARANKQPTTMEELASIRRLTELDNVMNQTGLYGDDSLRKRLGLSKTQIASLSSNIYQAGITGAIIRARGPEWAKGLAARILDLASGKSVAAGGAPLRQYDYAVAEGETIKGKDGSSRTVTGATGKRKPATTKVIGPAAGPNDKQIIPPKNVKGIIPRVGKFAVGAENGTMTDSRMSGSTTAQEIARERRISLNEAKKILKAERALSGERAKGTTVTEESGKAVSQKTKLDKQQMRQMRYDKVSRVSTPLAMAAGTATMAGAMMGAPESFTKMMLGVSIVSSILPLMTNPWMLAIGAVAGMGMLVLKFNNDLKKARQAGIDLAKAMTMSAEDVKELGVLTGRVSASEIGDRRRQNILAGGITEPQRQFGQNVMQSEFGKRLLGNVETLSKSGMQPQDVSKNISNQLGQAILQGVINLKEAQSIASALGEQLGSYEIPLNVSGNLRTIFGPDGKNLADNPLQVSLEIKKQSMENQAEAFNLAVQNRKPLVTAAGGAQVAGGAALMAAGGAIAATGFGAPLGGAVAAVGAAITLAELKQQNDAKAENLKLDTAAIQLGIEAVAQGQDILDSINRQYDSKIAQAKTQKEINDLEKERRDAIAAINAENDKTLQLLIDQKDQLQPGAFDAAIKASVDALYKEGPMSVFKDQAMSALDEIKDGDFKAQLQLGFASGDIDPLTLINLIKMVSGNENIEKNVKLLISEQGFANTSVLTQLLNTAAGGDQATFDVLLNYVNTNEKTFDEDLEAVRRIADFKGAYDVSLNMKTNGQQKIEAASRALGYIKDLPDKVTKEALMAANTDGRFNDALANWTALSQGKDQINKNLIVNYTVGSMDQNLINAATAAGMSVPEFLAKGFVAPTTTTIPPTTKFGDKKGREDTHLDELLKKLKMVRDSTINAEGTYKNLLKITSKKGIGSKFKGVEQQLLGTMKGRFGAGGANREFIAFIESLDNKTRKLYGNFDKGRISLNKYGIALEKAFNKKVVGEYQVSQVQALKDTKAQGIALARLQAAGFDTATALEMVGDANLAVAISSKKISSAEIKQLKKDTDAAKNAADALNLALKQEAIAAQEGLDSLQKTSKVISALKTLGPGIDENVLQKVISSPALMKDLYANIFDGAKRNTAEINALLDAAAKDRVANFAVQVQVDPGQAIQSAMSGVLNPARNILETYTQVKKTALAASPQFKGRLEEANAAVKRTAAATKAAQSTVRARQSAVKDARNNPAFLNAQAALKEREKLIDVEQKNIENARGLIAGYQKAIEGFKEKIDVIMADVKAKFDDKIDAIRNQIDSIQRDVALKYDAAINLVANSIEKIERYIEDNFSKPIQDLQDQSSLLSDELSQIDEVAEKVNEKYDAQAKALEDIKNLNQDIIDQQKERLNVAEALRSGDASAAARAISEARAAAVQRAQERAGGTLDAARQAELGGIKSAKGRTRAQITAMQKDLEAQIKTVENAQREYEISVNLKGLKEDQVRLERAKADELLVVQGLETQILKLEKERADFLKTKQSELDDLEAKIKEQELLVKSKEKEIDGLEAKIAEIKADAKYAQAEATIANQEVVIAGLETDLDKAQSELEDAQEAQQAAEDALAALQAEMDALVAKETEDLTKKLEEAEAALAAAFAKAIEDNKLLEDAIKNLATRTTDMQTAVAGIFSQISKDAQTAAGAVKAFISGAFGTTDNEGLTTSTVTTNPNIPADDAHKGIMARASAAARGATPANTKTGTNAVQQVADALKSAKPDAEALAKSQQAIDKAITSYAPSVITISEKLAFDAEAIKRISESYTTIAPLAKGISLDSSTYSAYMSVSRDSLSVQPSMWERIKGFITNAVSSMDSYIAKLQSALSIASSIASTISSLERTVTTTHIIRTVNIVETVTGTKTGSTGSAGPKMYGGKIKGYAGGGMVKPIYRPMGGLIPYMASGGPVNFVPMGSDTVPAMLTPGEYVVNKGAAKQFAPFLSAINESKYPSVLANKFKQMGADISNSFNKPIYSVSSPVQSSFIQPSYNISNSSANVSPTSTAISSVNDNSSAVYNYNVGITVGGTSASPQNIANAVMNEIKYIDSQRVRNQRVS